MIRCWGVSGLEQVTLSIIMALTSPLQGLTRIYTSANWLKSLAGSAVGDHICLGKV